MIINHMDGGNAVTNNIITSIRNIGSHERDQETIKTFLKNFLAPTSNMAIKENNLNKKPVTSPPVNTLLSLSSKERMKSINQAKEDFLNSTINHPKLNSDSKNEETLHYAQIAITTGSDDTRSTGGGMDKKLKSGSVKTDSTFNNPGSSLLAKKYIEQQPRKVSFKIKNASTSHRRPPLASRTVTITGSKVSDLTKKFNDLVQESQSGTVKQSTLVKTIEGIQSSSKYCNNNSSSASSTTGLSPNIKIVLRQRRGSKKRYNKKRCSSVDSIDKLVLSDSSNKIRVIRSKSDGNKIPKSPKKRLIYNDSSSPQSGSDSVDGSPIKLKIDQNTEKSCEPSNNISISQTNVVKNVIKKFECELIAKSNTNTILKKPDAVTKPQVPTKEKPKVPEKKSSLILTKNIVIKDGVPKIKTFKTIENILNNPKEQIPKPSDIVNETPPPPSVKHEPIYDKKRYKTNFIHTDKMPLKIDEIIHEDTETTDPIDEHKNSKSVDDTVTQPTNQSKVQCPETPIDSLKTKCDQDQEIAQCIANDSFLWRRKNSVQLYSDSEKSFSDSSYSLLIVTSNGETQTLDRSKENNERYKYAFGTDKMGKEEREPDTYQHNDSCNTDFESNLIEAYNTEVLIGFTTKPAKEVEQEDGYEPLELYNTPPIPEKTKPIKSIDRSSKINCPLPEIPKEKPSENIYHCLIEMRSHPEGDESSLHNYELCDHREERTRGDGDSDNGYEYCKSPVKPYCHTSSSGIRIADSYQPFSKTNDKNYVIAKSISGTSTISYEKIGSERIYEKIPSRSPKSKDSSPTSYNNRNSFVSSDYTGYNDGENIYDTIKHGDGMSLTHCYESIPNSPSMVKLRNNFKKQLSSAVQKRLSFDTVSNLSESTISSEQKTNSIYGQRSMISYNGQEIAFQVPNSDTSVSDKSDEWVDVSDEEKTDEQKIVIIRERSRGRKSPVSWSQKVRHQWNKTPKLETEGRDGESSDSGHLYESLEPVPVPIDDDFDSFDSDSDSDTQTETPPAPTTTTTHLDRLPEPPSGGAYTLTSIASAAQRKIRAIKRNLTKRYTVAVDGKTFLKSQNGGDKNKPKYPIYANCEKPEIQPIYSNIIFPDIKPVVNPQKMNGNFKEELKYVMEKKIYGEIPPPLPEKPPPEKPTTPTSENSKKENVTLSRKTYFSFKSRFKRSASVAVDINTDIPSALKITNSTFYLTDSMDGDSGFSNCDTATTDRAEVVPSSRGKRWAESSPCLALERPAVPPPPPPDLNIGAVNEELKRLLPTLPRKEKGARTRTSWYAECGAQDEAPQTPVRPTSTSWYAEAGLYQAGNISSSSGASSESQPASPLPHSLFTHEPLYQFYNAAKLESVCRESTDSDSDAYSANTTHSPPSPARARPSAMTLVTPRGPARSLWCEVPEVIASAVLSSLAPCQKRLQEAKFELLTSEASYLNSLNVLESHFIAHPAFRDVTVLPKDERDTLFGTISPVRKCSQMLLNALEQCWQENILLQGICDIVRKHADESFQVYVKYCENQALMDKVLQRLRKQPNFAATLKRLESHPSCQSLSLHSFLMLPMQRITRLPLLIDAVLKNLKEGDEEYQSCMDTLATLNNFVSQCNEGARNTERVEEMFRLQEIIEFPATMADPPSLAPACSRRDRRPVRWLVRSGDMTQLIWKTEESKLTFGKKFHKVPLHLLLFSDVLIVTRRRTDGTLLALDHCARSLLEVCWSEAPHAKHALLLTLLENQNKRTVEMLVSCGSDTTARRWYEALSPPAPAPHEAVYAGWDCPQVTSLYTYRALQSDELALDEGDVVNVTRKTQEGWYFGERIRDGETGWFPGAYTVEIASPHVRARNLRQRYRLLALSGTYLGQKKAQK